MRKFVKIKKIASMAAATAYVAIAMTSPVVASQEEVNAVINPLNNLKVLMFAIISCVGGIVCAFNIVQFSGALKDRDTSTMQTAGLGAAGGFIMCAISGVMAFIGVS